MPEIETPGDKGATQGEAAIGIPVRAAGAAPALLSDYRLAEIKAASQRAASQRIASVPVPASVALLTRSPGRRC